jgi:hypothetical protein
MKLRKGSMMGTYLLGAVALLAIFAVVRSLPDISRYLKMRNM